MERDPVTVEPRIERASLTGLCVPGFTARRDPVYFGVDALAGERGSAVLSSDLETTYTVDTTATAPPDDRVEAGSSRLIGGDRYWLERAVGRGGMGIVYLAHDEVLGRKVALKVIERRTDPHDGTPLEARLAARIVHENVVTVHDSGCENGIPWIAMEYLPGPSLREVLDARPTLPAEEALGHALAIARALRAAHGRDIVHHDLKPSNIKVCDGRPLKVLDFGLSVQLSQIDCTVRGGTKHYCAPEQSDPSAVSPAIDIWALGLLVAEMLGAGRPSSDAIERHRAWLDDKPLPPSVGWLVRRALSDNPAERPDAATAAAILDAALSTLVDARDGGRLDAEARLWSALGGLVAGQGRVVVVEGPSGFGKTRMLAALAEQAEQLGVRGLRGQGRYEARLGSFGPWQPIYAELIADRPFDALAEAVGPTLAPLLPLVDAVAPRRGLDRRPTVRLEGPARFEATLRVLMGLAAATLDGPCLVAIDDAQWLDSASWRLVERFADRGEHLVVLLARPTVPRPAAMLQALRKADLITIAAPGVSGRPAPRPDRSDGADTPERPGGESDARGAKSPAHPPEVAEALGRLAVVGLAIPAGLPDALGVDAALVERCVATGDVHRTAVGLEFRDHERHSLARERLDLGCRVDTHRRVADWLAAHDPRAAVERAAIAFHRREVVEAPGATPDDADRAALVEAAEAAGQANLEAGAFPEATWWFELCLRHGSVGGSWRAPPLRALRWYRGLSDAAHGRGDVGARSGYGARALALMGREPPSSRAGLLGRVVWGALRLAVPPIRRRNDEQQRAARLTARALGDRAVKHWFDNDRLAMVHGLIWGFIEARAGGPSPEYTLAAIELSAGLGFAGFDRVFRWGIRRAIEGARALDDAALEAYALLFEGMMHLARAEWGPAGVCIDESQALCDAIGDERGWGNAQVVRFWLAHYVGDAAEARRRADHLLRRALDHGHEQHQIWGLHSLGLVELRAGDDVEAHGALSRALEMLGGRGARVERLQMYAARALAACRLDERRAATDDADKAIEIAIELGRPTSHAVLEAYRALAEVYLIALAADWTRKSRRAWTAALDGALRQLDRYAQAFPIGRPAAALMRARALRLRGRERAATRLLQRARPLAEQYGLADERRDIIAALGTKGGG